MTWPEDFEGVCGALGCEEDIVLDEARGVLSGVANGLDGLPLPVTMLVCDDCYARYLETLDRDEAFALKE